MSYLFYPEIGQFRPNMSKFGPGPKSDKNSQDCQIWEIDP
jgi:hypothetical protein